MRLAAIILLTACFTFLGCSGCARSGAPMQDSEVAGVAPSAPNDPAVAPATQGSGNRMATRPEGGGGGAEASLQPVSLSQADLAKAAPVPVERKIIRNAQLTVEHDAPAEAARRIASIAESRGGFVVTSESRQLGGHGGGGKPSEVVTVELRVPSAQFDSVIGEILNAGGQVVEERKTGQDVTEEYIDLEARIRTQKELEAQFLVIMKSANKVTDALEVQTELANVRTEIERLEGRRRFLENQTSLSTIKVTLRPPAPLVSTTGFSHGVRSAFGDGIDAAAAIILVLIRVLIALVPVLLFIVLPLALLVRFALRRLRRRGAALT
jgi:hypothetical protein